LFLSSEINLQIEEKSGATFSIKLDAHSNGEGPVQQKRNIILNWS
jgi:hypothetical protein